MATAGLHEEVVDLVDCALCCERFNNDKKLPKSLPCLHTFCLECLIKYYKTKTELRIPCPNCKKTFTVPREGIESLPTNLIVKNLLPRFLESSGNKEPIRSKYCELHCDEKLTYFCDDCNIPLCSDCLLNQRCDRNHRILKLKDVYASLDAKIKDVEGSFGRLHVEGKEKLERMQNDLVASKDRLLKEANDKYEDVILKAKKWYADTTAKIEDNYDGQRLKLCDMEAMFDLEKFQMKILEVTAKKNEGLVVDVKSQLKVMQEDIQQLEVSSQNWSISLGSITEEASKNLDQFSLSHLTMPKVETLDGVRDPSNISSQIDGVSNKLLISLCKEHHLKSPCNWSVGLRLDEAVVCYNGETIIQKLSLRGDVARVTAERELPRVVIREHDDTQTISQLNVGCVKYMTNDGYVLLQYNTISYGTPNYIMLDKHWDGRFNEVGRSYSLVDNIVGVHSSEWGSEMRSELTIINLKDGSELQTVEPPTDTKWGVCLVVSKHPTSSAMVVVDCDNKNLVIYDTESEPIHTAGLTFQPPANHAVTCDSEYIYILSSGASPAVYIYNWQAELLHIMDRVQLGLDDGHYLWNIHAEDKKFIVAGGQQLPGGRMQVEYFKTYQVG